MPSIRSMFGDPNLPVEDGEGEAEFDIDRMMQSVDDIMNDRREQEPQPLADDQSPPAIEEDEDPSDDDSGGIPEIDQEETGEEDNLDEQQESSPPQPLATSDPFLDLPADRRAAILALDQAITENPEVRDRVFAVLTNKETQTQERPVEEPLPDYIDPESFEAKLWHRTQALENKLNGVTSITQQQQQAFVKQQAATAAREAGQTFASRYEGKLSPDDVLEIARVAGSTGIASKLAQGAPDLRVAYEDALEHVLWTSPVYRQRVIDNPIVQPGERPEAKDRKRKLQALSASASPASTAPPKRSPIETTFDGRLTEKSRTQLVRELASQMTRQSEGN